MKNPTGRLQFVLLSILVVGAAVVALLLRTTTPTPPAEAVDVGNAVGVTESEGDPARLAATEARGGNPKIEGEGAQPWIAPQRTTAETGAFGEQRPSRCSGTIRDPAGVPIEGAKVIVFEPALYGPGGTIVAETETGPDGKYAILLVPRETLRIGASVEGYQDTRELLTRGPLEARDFVLRSLEQ